MACTIYFGVHEQFQVLELQTIDSTQKCMIFTRNTQFYAHNQGILAYQALIRVLNSKILYPSPKRFQKGSYLYQRETPLQITGKYTGGFCTNLYKHLFEGTLYFYEQLDSDPSSESCLFFHHFELKIAYQLKLGIGSTW